MICLAVNTATTILSVALVDGDKVLHLFETAETRNQGNILFQHIDVAMKENGLSFKDIDLLAVVTGPGSFTGIRIGLAAMRGIALAAGIPIVGVSSFDLFATGNENNLVAVESFRDELYFRLGNQEPVNETPEDFVKRLDGAPLVVSGDAAGKIADLLPNVTLEENIPNALTLAEIASKSSADRSKPVPFYLRDADISKPKPKG